jgi:hypothetical protein
MSLRGAGLSELRMDRGIDKRPTPHRLSENCSAYTEWWLATLATLVKLVVLQDSVVTLCSRSRLNELRVVAAFGARCGQCD